MNRPHIAARCALVLALALTLAHCRGGHDPGTRYFGDVHPLDEVALLPGDLHAYVTLARGVLEGNEDPKLPIETPRVGRRVFLTVHASGTHRLVTTGLGATLRDSVRMAAQLARATPKQPQGVRLQLDVVTMVQAQSLEKSKKPAAEHIGEVGFLMGRESGLVGYVLPSEIIWREYYSTRKKDRGMKLDKIRARIAKRAKLREDELDGLSTYRFETVAVVEAAPGGPLRPVVRGVIARPPEPDVKTLKEAVALGADYLVRVTDQKGRYQYLYRAAWDKDGGGYNMLRHSGTTYSLLEAYEAFQNPAYLAAAERALGHIKGRLHPKPDWVETSPGLEDFLHLIDEERGNQSKSGGAGLALLAFTKHAALTRSAENLPIMRKLAHYLIHMQEEDGHFISYFQYRKDTPETQKEVLYYPGEAMLGLMRLYALDPNPQWLEICEKGARFLIYERDKGKDLDELEHDHWLSMALNEIYRVTRKQEYADHAFTIAQAILNKQKSVMGSPAPDFVGSFYRIPNSTPASVRLEAFVADITLARFMARDDQPYVQAGTQIAAFLLTQQFTQERGFFLPNLAKSLGGVREGVVNNNIRIDYVQHALSGMLGLSRVLGDPAYGTKGVPAVLHVPAFTAAELKLLTQ